MSFYSNTTKLINKHYGDVDELSDMKTREYVSLKLRMYRKQTGISVKSLAKMIKVARQTVHGWEKMERKPGKLAIERLKSLLIL